MPIGVFTMVGIYIIVWWTVLFAVLLLGTSQEDHSKPPTDGSQWGAPDKPDLKRKFITTTWVSAIAWIVVMVVIYTGWLPLPDFSRVAPNL